MTVRHRRILGWTVAALLVLVAAVLAWALTSQSALRWAVDRVSAATQGKLVVEGLDRTGIASLQARRIRYTDIGLRVDVRDAAVDVEFASLLRGRPVVRFLVAEAIDIATEPGPDDERPPSLPESLELPLPLEVRSLRIARMTLASGEAPVVLEDLDAAFSYDERRHALTLHSLGTPWTTVAGRLALGDARPFPIEGEVFLTPQVDGVQRAVIAIDGDLAAMGVGAVIDAYEQRVLAKAAITPFAGATIASIDGEVRGFSLRALDASLLRASLDADLAASVERDGRVAGDIRVRNREPGLPATERIPLVALQTRFAGSGADWTLSDIVLDGGKAGRLTGGAQIGPESVTARLRAQALNLAALHTSLYPTAFAGPIDVERRDDTIRFDLRLRDDKTEVAIVGDYADDRVTLTQARWSGPAGRIEADGVVSLAEKFVFEARGRLVGLDPSRLGDYPPASVHAQFAAKGQGQPLAVDVDARIADSRFRGQALSGVVRAHVLPERVRDLIADLRLGRASAHAQGSLGASGDRLAFRLDVPNARLIHEEARGSLSANGSVSGPFRTPSVAVTLQASKLRYGKAFEVGRADGTAAIADGGEGRIDVKLSARGLKAQSVTLDSLRAEIGGTRARHAMDLEVQAAAHRLNAHLNGGLDPKLVWQGRLTRLQVAGDMSLRLVAPVELTASAQAVRVGSARVDAGKTGSIDIAGLDWAAEGGLSTSGSLLRLALAGLQPLVPVPEAVRTLVVSGRWEISLGDTLSGEVVMTRESGDIVIPGTPSVPAKLSALRLFARAQGTQIAFEARAESGTFGNVTASGSTRAERRAGQWGIAGDAPIEAQLQARMPSLAWSRPLLGDAAELAGSVEVSLRAGGTFSNPVYDGHVRGQDLFVRVPDFGLTLRDGVLTAVFDGQQLAIQTLRFASGDGQISGTGSARLVPGDLSARIDLAAEQFTVLARPDRLVVVSGKAQIAWDPSRLRAKGQFTADRGVIELPPENTPTPSSDVVVLGSKPAPPKELNVEADLGIDLGQNFKLHGRGLDTRLAGTLNAKVDPKAGISLEGTVRTVDGTYTAFGNELTIKRGAVTFVGPVENPSLDILAVRTFTEVEVGVAVGGTALVPQVRLVSTPAMSDANKLSWLTLGRGLDEAGKNEAAVLQAAALALLSRGNTEGKGTIASRFGLDELSLGTASGTGERIVSIGKRLASNFYVGFERGITGAVNVVKITYDLSRRWSVQARAGSENAVDLFYTLGFR